LIAWTLEEARMSPKRYLCVGMNDVYADYTYNCIVKSQQTIEEGNAAYYHLRCKGACMGFWDKCLRNVCTDKISGKSLNDSPHERRLVQGTLPQKLGISCGTLRKNVALVRSIRLFAM